MSRALAAPALMLSVLFGPAPATAAAERLLIDRASLAAADARCGLLDGPARAALAAGVLQARGALLRSGREDAMVRRAEAAGARAGAARRCDDPALAADAGRAMAAISAWSQQQEMRFPAYGPGWAARRTQTSAWRVMQTAAGPANATVGLVMLEDGPAFGFEVASDAASATLIVRDRQLLGPDLVRPGATPPAKATRRFLAALRRPAAPKTRRSPAEGTLFVFPAAALSTLGALDPRDVAQVEIIRRDGSRSLYRFDVGDLAAARTFAAV
jgi:hypothetical protein